MHIGVWLHWYMVGFFALFGMWIFLSRRCFASIRGLVRVPGPDDPTADRLRAAIDRRDAREALPASAMASLIAVAALAAAIVGALTSVPTTLLYAVLCVVLAGTLANGYFHLRAVGTSRVASLRARDRSAAIPEWVLAVVVTASVTPLAFVDVVPLAAILVTAAAVAIAVTGVLVAQLPALLSGDDPAVEEYLDERLRAVRTLNLVATASAPPYVFEVITAMSVAHGLTAPHVLAALVALIALLVSCGWFFLALRKRPGTTDTERWSRAGV